MEGEPQERVRVPCRGRGADSNPQQEGGQASAGSLQAEGPTSPGRQGEVGALVEGGGPGGLQVAVEGGAARAHCLPAVSVCGKVRLGLEEPPLPPGVQGSKQVEHRSWQRGGAGRVLGAWCGAWPGGLLRSQPGPAVVEVGPPCQCGGAYSERLGW